MTDCLDCIGGMSLSHADYMGGACFRVCLTCQPGCHCCHGQGCFPSWTTDMTHFIAAYNDAGLMPVLCHTCGGVVGVARIREENP